jgi:hypothetical protein
MVCLLVKGSDWRCRPKAEGEAREVKRRKAVVGPNFWEQLLRWDKHAGAFNNSNLATVPGPLVVAVRKRRRQRGLDETLEARPRNLDRRRSNRVVSPRALAWRVLLLQQDETAARATRLQ